jgi:hypothetical protein
MAACRDKRRSTRPWVLDISYVDRRSGERRRYFRNAKLQTAEGARSEERMLLVTLTEKGFIPEPTDVGSGEEKQVWIEVLGGVAERSKAAVLKTAVPATVPGVRIPSPPLRSLRKRTARRVLRPVPEGAVARIARDASRESGPRRACTARGRPPRREATAAINRTSYRKADAAHPSRHLDREPARRLHRAAANRGPRGQERQQCFIEWEPAWRDGALCCPSPWCGAVLHRQPSRKERRARGATTGSPRRCSSHRTIRRP